MQLLKRGFFDVTIVFPPNRGSSTKNDGQKDKDNLVAQNEQSNNDNASAKAAYLSPDKAKIGRINSYSDIMAVQQLQTKSTQAQQPFQTSPEMDEITQKESAINDFLESEAVRTVMLADYLKALGVYQETLKYKESQQAKLETKVYQNQTSKDKRLSHHLLSDKSVSFSKSMPKAGTNSAETPDLVTSL